MAITLSQVLPPTRSGRTFFAATSLLGLCAFLQLGFLGWYFVRGGNHTVPVAQASSPLSVSSAPRFAETTQPIVASMEQPSAPLVRTIPTDTPPAESPEPYATLPRPTPAPAQRLPGGASGDALEQARALRERGDMRAALSRLREALVAEPDNVQAIAEMALTYEVMQQNDQAFEQWQRIYNMGKGVGALYELADNKLHNAPSTAAATENPAARRPGGGAASADTAVLKITDITFEDIPDPSTEKKIALKIVVKGRPGVVIDPEKVKIEAYFYDLLDGRDIVQTDAQTDFAWLTPPPINWANDKSEVLEALYLRPKAVALMPGAPAGLAPASTRTGNRRRNGRNDKIKGSPAPDAAADPQASPSDSPAGGTVRTYLGYSVRLYYAGRLQEVKADPVRLLQEFPAPPTLAPENPPATDSPAPAR